MTTAVGLVMGLHAAFEIFVNGVDISWQVIWTYLPVSSCTSCLWPWAMWACGTLSCPSLSPICNTSGALVAIASILFLGSGKGYGSHAVRCSRAGLSGRSRPGNCRRPGGRNPSRRPASSVQLQIRQILAGFGASGRLLPPGRRRYLCRQSGSGAFGRSLCQCGL